MARSRLTVLRGLKVTDADLTQGDAGLLFENGASLNIYNPFEVSGDPAQKGKSLAGKTVTEVEESTFEAIISLSGGVSIRIDMRDEAFSGPEAMQLRVPGHDIVVWN